MTPEGGAIVYLRDPATGKDARWLEISPDEVATTGVYGFNRDG